MSRQKKSCVRVDDYAGWCWPRSVVAEETDDIDNDDDDDVVDRGGDKGGADAGVNGCIAPRWKDCGKVVLAGGPWPRPAPTSVVGCRPHRPALHPC